MYVIKDLCVAEGAALAKGQIWLEDVKLRPRSAGGLISL